MTLRSRHDEGITATSIDLAGIDHRRRRARIDPVPVAAWIEAGTRELSRALGQAADRHLFDWLVNGQVAPTDPPHTVR